MDSNAHSTLWNSPANNNRGDKVEEHISLNNLYVCNTGASPTFITSRAATIIDVTLCTPGISGRIDCWRVDPALVGSDHQLICFDILITISATPKKCRNYRKGDWLLFQNLLDTPMTSIPVKWSERTLEAEADKFSADILNALNKSHPLMYANIKLHPFKWWNKQASVAQRSLKKATSFARLHNSDAASFALKQARKEYHKVIRRAKRRSWKDFCEDVTDVKKAAQINKIIQAQENKALGIVNKDGLALDPKETLNHLVNTHFPGNIIAAGKIKYRDNIVDIRDETYITDEKVKAAIDSFASHKSPGMDGIKPVVLKNLSLKARQRLTALFKASLMLGYTPQTWRQANVVFIPKYGKEDYSECRSFRPITLSSFILKSLERILLWYLEDKVLQNNPLHNTQHAFRKGRGTESALTETICYIEEALTGREHALCTFLDIQGAFDNIRPEIIIEGLQQRGTPNELINWCYFHLKNRLISVEYKGIKVSRSLTLGTPQGGVLSPLLWNIACDKLLKLFDNGAVRICGYADDAVLMARGSCIGQLKVYLQNAVNKALRWGTEAGLTFSPSKTTTMLFTRSRSITLPPSIQLDGEDIPYVTEVSYLGLTLDPKLSWDKHIERKIKAAKHKINKVRSAMGKIWGASPKMMRWIYTGIIRPAISYGSLVWAKACMKEKNIAKLRKVNRLALLSFGFLRRSTPTAGAEVINHVMPLDLHILMEAVSAWWRTGHWLGSWSASTGTHRQCIQAIIKALNLKIEGSTDRIVCERTWNHKYKFEPEERTLDMTTQVLIYTDGSKVNRQTGSGLVAYREGVLQHTSSFHLDDNNTVFQAEVYAIKQAAMWLLRRWTFQKTMILSDSLSAIQALCGNTMNSQLVKETIGLLDQVGARNFLSLRWVKAHIGIEGNEAADTAAGIGSQQIGATVKDCPKTPSTVIKNLIKEAFERKWMTNWSNRADCRQTKQWFPILIKRNTHNLLSLSRKEYSLLCQFITGHNFLNRHNALVNKRVDAECQLCLEEEDQTSLHIFAECPALAMLRQNVLGSPFLVPPLVWSVKQLSSFLREAHIGLCEDLVHMDG
jgi:ribonuclease HI